MANEVINIKEIKNIVSGKVVVNESLTVNYCPNKTELTNNSIVPYYTDSNNGIEINNINTYSINQLVLMSDVIYKDKPVPVFNATVFEYTTYIDGEMVKAPYNYASEGCEIAWEGGIFQKGLKDEVHYFATKGTHEVSVRYRSPINVMYCKGNTNITKVLHWGEFIDDRSAEELVDTFADCINLVSVPPDYGKIFKNIKYFNCTFFRCESLTTINGIFDYATELISAQMAFYGCKKLINFYALFNNCPNLTDLLGTFDGCSSLTLLNVDLFAKCPKIAMLDGCFYNCSALQGSTPLSSNGNKLWEESGTSGSINGANCFYNCTYLTDYASIPESWKVIK